MQKKKIFKLITASIMMVLMLSNSVGSVAYAQEMKDELNQRLYKEVRQVYNILSITPKGL